MKILIAPLDWGLGHATRCIPLIRYLLQQDHQVYIAAEGAAARLLADNFPELPQLALRGYRISYSKSKRGFTAKIFLQIPKILAAIRREHRWLQQMQQQHRFDLIFSDNRYGLYNNTLPSVILTHQLQIRSGMGTWTDNILRRLHYRLLQRFSTCWIVDEEKDGGLSGTLAHPAVIPAHAVYTGILSQFDHVMSAAGKEQSQHILVLLSGPEPMRGQLEQLALQQLTMLQQYKVTLVAGNPSGSRPAQLPEHITWHSHLDAGRLAPLLQQASLVVCRSGYSTIMDLAVLGKKALLIPTPGQTEQEYLAAYLSEKKYFSYTTQDSLQLERAIPMALAAAVHPVKPGTFSAKAAQLLAPLFRLASAHHAAGLSAAPAPGIPG